LVDLKEAHHSLTGIIDDCLKHALGNSLGVAEISTPPLFNHLFMHRRGGFLDAHIDQYPDVYTKFLPGIGEDFECYNIWILIREEGYDWNPIAMLDPQRSNMDAIRQANKKGLDLRLVAPFKGDVDRDYWRYWSDMKPGDMILWKSRKIYHGGAVIKDEADTQTVRQSSYYDIAQKRRSFDLRRLVGKKGWLKKHQATLEKCSASAGKDFELY